MALNKISSCIILSVILILSITVNIATFNAGHNWENSDFAGYISQAGSLADGTFDELVSHDKFIAENSTQMIGTILSPWGFPLILSPFYYLFGTDIFVMKVVTNLFFALSLFVLYFIFQERLTNINNLLLITIIALNPWFFDFKDNVLSDIPFLFFSLLPLFLINRSIIQEKIWINKSFSFFLIGLLIFMSYNIRAVGLILLPTLMLVQFFKSRSSQTVISSFFLNKYNYVPYITFIILYVLGMLISPGSDSAAVYFDNLSNISLKGLLFDIKYYAFLPSRFFPFLFLKMHGYGFEYNKFSLVIYAVMLLFVIFGIIKHFRKDYIFVIYMLITIPVALFFSSRQGARLLIPIFPFFLYFLIKGISSVVILFEGLNGSDPVKISVAHLFCIGMIIISLPYIVMASHKNITHNSAGMIEGPYSEDSVGLFSYIKNNTDKEDAVVFYKPRSMVLFADRKSFTLSKHKSELDRLYELPAEYIAYNKSDNPFDITSKELRQKFNCAYENNTFILCALRNNTK